MSEIHTQVSILNCKSGFATLPQKQTFQVKINAPVK